MFLQLLKIQETSVLFELTDFPDHNYKASQYTLEWQLLVGFIFSLMSPVSNLNFQIIVLENGKVIEQGPHDVLLSKGGRYAELWFQQNNSDTIDPAAVNLEV